MDSTRITLLIYAKSCAGQIVYHTRHIGFFPARVVNAVVEALDIRGLAYHSDVAQQIGEVDVAATPMTKDLTEKCLPIIARREVYEPPQARGAWREAV